MSNFIWHRLVLKGLPKEWLCIAPVLKGVGIEQPSSGGAGVVHGEQGRTAGCA